MTGNGLSLRVPVRIQQQNRDVLFLTGLGVEMLAHSILGDIKQLILFLSTIMLLRDVEIS
jgi:hypothetical protein